METQLPVTEACSDMRVVPLLVLLICFACEFVCYDHAPRVLLTLRLQDTWQGGKQLRLGRVVWVVDTAAAGGGFAADILHDRSKGGCQSMCSHRPSFYGVFWYLSQLNTKERWARNSGNSSV